MGIEAMISVIMSDVTFINMMVLILIVAVGGVGYGLYYKLKRVERELDDIYYLLMDISNRME